MRGDGKKGRVGRTLAVLFVLFDRAVAGELLCGAVRCGAWISVPRLLQRERRREHCGRTLEGLQEFLRGIFGGYSREGGDGLAAVALLDTDVDVVG